MKELSTILSLLENIPSDITNQDDLNLVKGIGNRLFKAINILLWKDGKGLDAEEFDDDVNALMILHSGIPDKFNVVRKLAQDKADANLRSTEQP
jgi:hypothetical protein